MCFRSNCGRSEWCGSRRPVWCTPWQMTDALLPEAARSSRLALADEPLSAIRREDGRRAESGWTGSDLAATRYRPESKKANPVGLA